MLTFANRGFPFTPLRLRLIAFQLASQNKRKGFSPEKGIAGKAWLKGFLARHPQLRKKINKNLAVYRARGANKKQIKKFFKLYKDLVDEWDLEWHPNYIWNVDECGVPDIPDDGQVVIGEVGKRAMTTVGGEKGVNTTCLSYISAGGMHSPPMILFKGQRMNNEWREMAPSGYTIRLTKTGYISAETFTYYGHKFVNFLKEKKILGQGRKVVILLDLHKSHLFNWDYMQLMLDNNIEVLSFPLHCTHVMQPLDDTPYATFKKLYHNALSRINFDIAGMKIEKKDFFKVFVPTFTQAMSNEIIRKGFANTGIYPINPKAQKLEEIKYADTYDQCKFLRP